MILTKQFLEQVLPAFSQDTAKEDTEMIYGEHHFDASLKKTKDDVLTITIKYKKEESLEAQFEQWCKQIDDDIFVEACERFEAITGMALTDIVDKKLYDSFKSVVKQIVKEKVDRLCKAYLN